MGYPADRKESQNKNVRLLDDVKKRVAKPLPEIIRALDPEMVKTALTPAFLDCFYANCQDAELEAPCVSSPRNAPRSREGRMVSEGASTGRRPPF